MTPKPANWMQKLATFSAVMVGAALPLRALGVSTQQAALALALLGALAVVGIDTRARAHAKAALISPLSVLIMGVFTAWAFTVPFSFSPLGSLKIGGRTALFLLATVPIWAVLATQDKPRLLACKVLVGATFALNLVAIVSLNGLPGVLTFLQGPWPSPTTTHYALKAFADAAMCLVPVALWAGRRLGGAWRWWGYTSAPMAVAVLVQTTNRSALAGFLAMAIVVMVQSALAYRRHIKTLFGLLVATVSAGSLWLYTKEASRPLIAGTYAPDWLIDPHRQFIWAFTFKKFLDHPWVGNGIDQINRLPGASDSIPGLSQAAQYVPSHPHNWVLEILSETGVIGLTPVLIVLGFITWKAIQRHRETHSERALAQLALIAGFWSSALFNFSIWAVWWELTFFVLYALLAADGSRTSGTSPCDTTKVPTTSRRGHSSPPSSATGPA